MHDFLIALVFVSMVAAPAVVASWPAQQEDEVEGKEAAASV
jgi:hypothetical protein